MSASTRKSWWVTQPGALMSADSGGGAVAGVVGMLLGVPILVHALTLGIGALGVRVPVLAAFQGVGALIVGFIGVALTSFGERAFAGSINGHAGFSAGRVAVALRTALAAAMLLGVGAALAHVWGRRAGWAVSGDEAGDNVVAALAGLVVTLAVCVPLSRKLVGLGVVRWQRPVNGWAGVTLLLVVVGLVVTAYACVSQGSLDALLLHGRWVLWTVAGSALAVVMAASARKQLSIWDGADRWRDATLTPDLRLVFPDGSGSRAASAYFNGYAGPVVVMPTAAEAGAVFRGDGAPADGWVVPGTRAALEEAVRCARAMAAVTVAAVALVATAPLAVWLVSLVG